MKRTREAEFLVIEPDTSSVFATGTIQHLWFQSLEGEKKGRRVRIPLYDNSIDEEIRNKLQTLSEHDVVSTVLESETGYSSWRPVKLEKVGEI